MGSPQYLSPEQIRGDDLDGRSDVFSLGVVLYELLSGKRPFDGETITTLVYQILHKEPPPVSALRSIPPRLEQLLRKMLAKDRAERSATAGQVAEELAAIERDLDDETLSAPAAPALAATYVLPRTTPRSVIPPPPPQIPTHRSSPPSPQVTVPSPVAPATGASRSGVATEGISPKRWVPLVAAAVLIVAAAVGWLLFRRSAAEPGPADQIARQTVTGAPTPTPGPAEVLAEPTPAADRSLRPAATPFPPAVETPRGRSQLPETEPSPRREPPLVEPRQTPVPVQPMPTPTPSEPQRPQAEEPAPTAPETADDSRPLPTVPGADHVVRTGLSVAFRVTPPDAMVLVDSTVIGRAKEWSGEKGSRPYILPGPGEYRVRIRKDGMKEFRIAVQAGETGGVTPIIARLSPLPAAEVEAGDLRTVRVAEAVAFRVRPPGAVILVNDQIAGPALKFSGGLRGGWLNLPPGRHRISVKARGHRRYDMIVEVMPGAIQKRERIDVNLFEGGDD
jgi:hypothetical protein